VPDVVFARPTGRGAIASNGRRPAAAIGCYGVRVIELPREPARGRKPAEPREGLYAA